MTQEDTDLLFKDLCGRLPYGVKCLVNYTICNETTDYNDVKSSIVDTIVMINQQTESYFFKWLSEWFDFDEFKPYLFPLSSMTDEQKKELNDKLIELELKALNNEISHIEVVRFEINYYLKNHFDYNGLIDKGLVNDATGLNIY
jgi:hypothetical protein